MILNSEEYHDFYDEENARRIRNSKLIEREMHHGLEYLERRYVEDMSARVCLYHSLKEIPSDFDLASYPYLLNPIIRNASGISLDKLAVIVDEAHNLEKACDEEKIISFELIDGSIREFREKCLSLIEVSRDKKNWFNLISDSILKLRTIVAEFSVSEDEAIGKHLDKADFASRLEQNPEIVDRLMETYEKIEDAQNEDWHRTGHNRACGIHSME